MQEKKLGKYLSQKISITKNIRFSEIELLKNARTKYRFNIVDTPVLILAKNNKYIQLTEFPSEANIIKFLNSTFENPKDLPKQISNSIYYYKLILDKSSLATEKINEFLKSVGIEKFKVEPIMLFVIISIVILALIIFCICGGNAKKEKKEKIKKTE